MSTNERKRTWPPWLVFALKAIYACALGVFFGFLYLLFTGRISPFRRMRQLQANLFEQQKLPGTAELRSDGCQSVIVSTPAFRAAHPTQSGARGPGSKSNETWVLCMPLLLRTPPTCDRLARHYASVAHPSGPFSVSVEGPTQSGNCRQRFDASGLPLLADGGL